jgi:hypothetical protein
MEPAIKPAISIAIFHENAVRSMILAEYETGKKERSSWHLLDGADASLRRE